MAQVEDFTRYVAAASPRLLRTAFLLTHDHGQAEDLLQSTLAKCWNAWSRIQGDPDAYVRRTMINTYSTWWRRRWRSEIPTDDVPDTADTPAGEPDDRDVLWAALARLPRRQRIVIVLRFYEDLSVHTTAAHLGCSEGTVKSQTSKALRTLRLDQTLHSHEDITEGVRT